MMTSGKNRMVLVGTGAAMSGLFALFNAETLFTVLSDAWQAEVVKYTTAFVIAAWLHRGWVRKDMSEQFSKISDAINNVATTLSQDLAAQAKRLVNLEDNVGKLSGRVDMLETKTPSRRKKNEEAT